MIVGFDIETIPNAAMADRLPEPEVKLGNVKDPVKIAEKKEEARSKQIEKMALEPMFGRVLSFVGYHHDLGPYARIIEEDTDEEERKLIKQIMNILASGDDSPFCPNHAEPIRLATWNGKKFDLPFVFKRAAILGIDPGPANSLAFWTRRYDNSVHVDLMTEWDQFQPGVYTKLDTFASFVLGEGKTEGIDVTEFPAMMKTVEGRETILNYNTQDALICLAGFKKLAGLLF